MGDSSVPRQPPPPGSTKTIADDENSSYKNRTLRFTNNNFLITGGAGGITQGSGFGGPQMGLATMNSNFRIDDS